MVVLDRPSVHLNDISRNWGAIVQGAVWSFRVGLFPPLFNDYFILFQQVEHSPFNHLIMKRSLKLSQHLFSHGKPGTIFADAEPTALIYF
jgi:hypothetical protein